MKKPARYICLTLVTAFLLSMFTSCYDNREIDDLAYVVAIGFDKGKTNDLRITLQIAKPGSTGGDSSGSGGKGGGGGEKPFVITSVEAPTILSALNMANSYINRQINVSNAVALIFSKTIAEKGMEYLINAISREREFRPNMYVVVSRTTAEEYINNIKPTFEANPSKYYYLNYTGYRYTSFTANTLFHYFSSYMDSPDRQAVAILAGVNKFETSTDIGTQNSTYGVKERTFPLEGDFKAGDIPRTGENKSEIMGLAVFDGDKMVGELDGEETAYYLMVTGEYKNAYWTLPDPMIKGKYVLLNIKQQRSPMKKVSYVNGKPQVSIKLLLESDISSIQSGLNYERGEDKSILEKSSADFIKAGIKKLLDKTAKEFHSDIFGLGSGMRSKFLTLQEFDNFNWKSKYKDSGFNVDVTMKIRRTGLLVRTVKASNSKGEGG